MDQPLGDHRAAVPEAMQSGSIVWRGAVIALGFLASVTALAAEHQEPLQELIGQLLSGSADAAFIDGARELAGEGQAELLALAVARGETDAVAGLLDAGVPVDARNETGWTPLMVALFNGHEELALMLIDHGADPEAEAPDRVSVASLAEAMGSREVLWRLAAATGSDTGAALLAAAARVGDQTAVREALLAGVAVDASDNEGWTPLLYATASGHPYVVLELLGSGADPNKAALDGLVPLAAAILAGDDKAVLFLLGFHADPNAKLKGIPLLSVAIAHDNAHAVENLLAYGADPSLADDEGVRPAKLAQELGMLDLVERLGGLADPAEPATPEALLAAILADNADEVERLLDAGVSAEVTFPDGWKPLHVAVAKGSEEIVPLLLARGAKVGDTTPGGDTALMLGVRSELDWDGQKIIVRALAEHARKTEPAAIKATDSQGRTALMNAVILGRSNVIASAEALIRGAIDVPDREGIRPLTAAVLSNNPSIVSDLVDYGAAIDMSGDRLSPQDIARQKGYWAVLAALPDDRRFPVQVRAGMNREARMKVQETLRDWGYYQGTIDGVLGTGSAAALRQFLLDRRAEMLGIVDAAPPSGEWRSDRFNATNDGEVELRVDGPRSSQRTCQWELLQWRNSQSNRSTEFVGCVRGGKEWNSNGFGLVKYVSGKYEVMLLGEDGWNSKEILG